MDIGLNISDFNSRGGSSVDTGTTYFSADPVLFELVNKYFIDFCNLKEENCGGSEAEMYGLLFCYVFDP